MLEVSTSGYDLWLKRPHGRRFRSDEQMRTVIRSVYDGFGGIYGSPPIHAELRSIGYQINHKRVERLMREMGLNANPPKPFVPRTTDSRHDHPIAPDLLQQDFTADGPNQKWVGDITYIPTDSGWLYLAVVIDLFSRTVVGWSMSTSLATPVVSDALEMAIASRRPPPGLIFHSDRGCQYASGDYRQRLQAHGIRASMSRKGCCYDNAVAESFFHSLKNEEVHRRRYQNQDSARAGIFRYLATFYNTRRRHSTLGYLSPDDYERYHHAA